MEHPRILIADDHTLIAEALQKLLEDEFNVVAIVYDGHQLTIAAEQYRPDVVVVDIGMPGLNGLSAGQRIKKHSPGVKIVYVTVSQDPELRAEAFRTGASAFLSKTSAGSELVRAMHTVLNDEQCINSKNMDSAFPMLGKFNSRPLTDRQLDVLQLLAEGKSMKEVAAELRLATRTVAFHKYRLMKTLRLSNDAEIVQYAIRQRIIFDQRLSQ